MSEIWKKTQAGLQKDPTYRNMFHMMSAFGDDTAAEISDQNGQIIKRSYREYINMSYDACGFLQQTGIGVSGRLIGFMYDTCMDWPVIFWGVLMAGGIPLLMNPAVDAAPNAAILKEAGAAAYIAAAPLAGCDLPFIDAKQVLRPGTAGTEVWSDQVALCTSGTTGSSRIFLYDSRTIVAQLLSFNEAKQHNPDMPFVEDIPCKLLAFLPFHHVFGFSVIYILYSCTGKTLVYLRDRSVQTILDACRRHEVTHLYCVPMFFNALAGGLRRKMITQMGMTDEMLDKMCDQFLGLQASQIGQEKVQLPEQLVGIQQSLLGTKIRSMITGGGHVPLSTMRMINAIGYPLYNGFGMTECGIISVEMSLNPLQRVKGSIGKPFALTEYRIDGDGETGELLIRGDALYSASIENGKVIPHDKTQWFATGDIVRRTGDGLFIEGRCKDVIINASGENIYPDELEDAFAALPGVARVCILGLKDGEYENIALVAEKGASNIDTDALTDAFSEVNEKLPVNMKAARLLLSARPLPLSGSLKVKRRKLKEAIESGEWECEEIRLFAAPAAKEETVPELTAAPLVDETELSAIRDTVRRIVADKMNTDEKTIGDREHFVLQLGADSLTLFSAFCALEDEYGVVITDNEYKKITNVDETARLIYAKLHHIAPVTGAEAVPEPEKPAKRVTDFKDSEEYIALEKRKSETFTEETNPYFQPHDSVIRDTSVIGGIRAINLGSYNYLGMSGNEETMQAAIDAIRKYGTSASGSRTLAGEKTLYQKLERTIADWKHTEDAIVCTGGWATNLSFVSCFMREGDLILYDVLSHNSVSEGVALSKAESKAFGHNDLAGLEKTLQKTVGKYNKVLIVVEGVYSMDGDIAPIPEFVRLKKQYGCFLMVDEAHSGGVIGDWAGGVDDYFNLDPKDVDIKMGTLSKALGTCGGYIAADHSIVEYLRYSMNGFVFTAGIAPPLAAACMKAIEIIRRDNSAVTQLHRNVEYFVKRAREEGMDIGLAGDSAIVPVLIGSDADAARLSAILLKKYGVFVPPAMYPAVPMGESRLRFTISATHSIEQLETAISALSKLMHEEGFLH
ncbi:MAG: hypothetical protein CW338_05765 [Clostridiales bacterium]|nr:hypothetical protein [Clostridiales bacterium]